MNIQPNNYNQHGVPTTSYYQPQFGTPRVYVTQGSNLNHATVQPNPVSSVSHRSHWLFGIGVIDVIMSGVIATWTMNDSRWTTTVYLASLCAVFHLILGTLSITGSRNGVRYRGCIIASLVLSIIGPWVFILAPSNMDEWSRLLWECKNCSTNETDCTSYCYIKKDVAFYDILIYTLLPGIVCVVISVVTCCNLCYCCVCCYTGKTPSRKLIYTESPPPYDASVVPQHQATV